MSALQAFHIGFLVADLDRAMDRFASILGVTFRPPATMDLTVSTMHRPAPHGYQSRITYSVEGPPYFELVEADGSDYKGLHQGERIHHIGLWVPDVAQQRQTNADAGLRDEVSIYYPRDHDDEDLRVRQWFNDPVTFHGVRLEFFDREWEPDFTQWLNHSWPAPGEPQ
jgi:hypothetical protein